MSPLSHLIPLAFLLAPAAAPAQYLPVELLFDGKPLQAAARPEGVRSG